MRNIKIIVAYDGTGYHGWQRQGVPRSSGSVYELERPEAYTVQGLIEAVLEIIHKRPVPLTGAGRTDAGVHAVGQAANFRTGIEGMEARRFVPAINGLLPPSIRVLSAEEVPPSFHARFDAKARLYRYVFVCGREEIVPSTLGGGPALRLRRHPDIALLNDYARLLRGETDCALFTAAGDRSKSKSRYIYHAAFFMEAGRLVFEIRANAFLWKMVRSAAGTMLMYEEKKRGPEDFADALRRGSRSLAGPTLPPRGLYLWRVDY